MNSRQIAWTIIVNVLLFKKHSNSEVLKVNKNNLIPKKDKKLIVHLVYGTLQNKLYLEHVLSKVINFKKTNKKIIILLLIALYQHKFLNKIPDYAIVNETVEISKKIKKRYSGFVNAVLKIIFADSKEKFTIDVHTKIQHKVLEFSFPEKLFNIIKKQYGEEIALKVMEDNTNRPKYSYRVNLNKISTNEIIEKYGESYGIIPSNIAKTGIISDHQLINTELFTEGYITAQDEMSVKTVELLNPIKEDSILDMCAAPGGKTTHIASLVQPNDVIACDISEKRIERIKENSKRLGISNIKYKCADSSKIRFKKTFDKILLDAPCSGMGVLKRRPELKYKNLDMYKNKNNKFVLTQRKLLSNAYNLLNVNGILVYSTCTINIWENQKQIDWFLKEYPNVEIILEKQYFGFEDATDGFYMCRLKKNPIEKN